MRFKTKKKSHKIYFFFKLYFIITFLVGFFLASIYFTTGYWNQIENKFKKKFFYSGISNYLKIHKIGYKIISSSFDDIDKLNINISFKNQLILEKNREKVLKKDGLNPGTTFNFKSINASINSEKKKRLI